MRIYRKNLFLTLLLVVFFISLTSCSKTSDSGYKYPRNFPQECVALYERWWILLDKMKATGRFEEESLEQRNSNFTSFIKSFANPPRGERTPPMEEYIQACIVRQQTLDIWEKGIENIDSKSNEELARTVGGVIKSK